MCRYGQLVSRFSAQAASRRQARQQSTIRLEPRTNRTGQINHRCTWSDLLQLCAYNLRPPSPRLFRVRLLRCKLLENCVHSKRHPSGLKNLGIVRAGTTSLPTRSRGSFTPPAAVSGSRMVLGTGNRSDVGDTISRPTRFGRDAKRTGREARRMPPFNDRNESRRMANNDELQQTEQQPSGMEGERERDMVSDGACCLFQLSS